MDNELMQRISELLEQAHLAHAEAFADVNGVDPDWPIWYADHLHGAVSEVLGVEVHKSQLIYCLMEADIEHQALSADSPWPVFYAKHLMECHAPADHPAEEKLALYHFQGCPFCAIAREPIERLGVDVELRDIYQDRQYLDELFTARGRATVPVLRISGADGEDRWMPESRDIVHYIETTYG
jgi:glutaredoxin